MDIRAILKRVSHQDMSKLMMGLIVLDKKAKERTFQFLEEKGYLNNEQLAQKYYHEYRDKFAETIDIISEFNMYGVVRKRRNILHIRIWNIFFHCLKTGNYRMNAGKK